MKLVLVIFLMTCFLLGGCASKPQLSPSSEFAPIQPIPKAEEQRITGGVFDNGNALLGSKRTYRVGDLRVGDLVTVILSESTQASRSNNVSTSRISTNDVFGPNEAACLLPGSRFLQGIKTDGNTITNTGTGATGQNASLVGSVASTVVDVMSNGNLIIFGEKQLALTEGSEFIQLKGVIRPSDIQPDNTVLSNRIANAQFSYRGTGDLANGSKPGWGTRLLYKAWPF